MPKTEPIVLAIGCRDGIIVSDYRGRTKIVPRREILPRRAPKYNPHMLLDLDPVLQQQMFNNSNTGKPLVPPRHILLGKRSRKITVSTIKPKKAKLKPVPTKPVTKTPKTAAAKPKKKKVKKRVVPTCWLELYRPLLATQMVGRAEQIRMARQWMGEDPGTRKPILLLHGACGTGKTTLANVLLHEAKFSITETNTSDVRGFVSDERNLERTGIYRVLQETALRKMDATGKPLALILEEIDGMASSGLVAVEKFLKKNRTCNPIIATCNDLDKNLRAFAQKFCTSITFRPLSKYALKQLCLRIAEERNALLPGERVDQILTAARGDARQVVLGVQAYLSTASDTQATDSRFTPFDECRALFTNQPRDVVVPMESYTTALVAENYPRNCTSLDQLEALADEISRWDICRSWQGSPEWNDEALAEAARQTKVSNAKLQKVTSHHFKTILPLGLRELDMLLLH